MHSAAKVPKISSRNLLFLITSFRISATAVAERVAEERAERIGATVGYQIRLVSQRVLKIVNKNLIFLFVRKPNAALIRGCYFVPLVCFFEDYRYMCPFNEKF